MTLAATVTRGRNIPGTWQCEDKKITKNGENNPFSNPCFSVKKKIPSIMAGTNLENKS
jgi:hypothetical protein